MVMQNCLEHKITATFPGGILRHWLLAWNRAIRMIDWIHHTTLLTSRFMNGVVIFQQDYKEIVLRNCSDIVTPHGLALPHRMNDKLRQA